MIKEVLGFLLVIAILGITTGDRAEVNLGAVLYWLMLIYGAIKNKK